MKAAWTMVLAACLALATAHAGSAGQEHVSLGTGVGPDGAVVDERSDFVAGQPIHLGMAVGDSPTKATVRVVWIGPDERKLGEETKLVPPWQDHMSFAVPDTSAWPAGAYRVEVWSGKRKLSERRFRIAPAS